MSHRKVSSHDSRGGTTKVTHPGHSSSRASRLYVEKGAVRIGDLELMIHVVLEYEEDGDPRTECPTYIAAMRKAFA